MPEDSASQRFVWYVLTDLDRPPNMSTATKLILSAYDKDIDDVRARVVSIHSAKLGHLYTNDLTVFRNITDQNAGRFASPDTAIDGLGKSAKQALILVPLVPPRAPPSNSTVQEPAVQSSRSGSSSDSTASAVTFENDGPIPVQFSITYSTRRRLQFVTLPCYFVRDSGTGRSNQSDTILFIRGPCRAQIDFISDKVIEQAKVGMIYGQPGSGKSITAYYAVGCLSTANWNVTWVHLVHGTRSFPTLVKCICMKNGTKYLSNNMTLSSCIADFDIIVTQTSDANHILVIDGFVEGTARELVEKAHNWLQGNKRIRRLIFVASMGSGEQRKPEYNEIANIEPFIQYSWTWEEYVSAVTHPAFVSNVWPCLDSSDSSDAIDRLQAKYYYAGGCARFMFQWTTQAVISEIHRLVNVCDDLTRSTDSKTGNASSSLSNTLISDTDDNTRVVVSKYAAMWIGYQLGPLRIINLANETCIQGNPVAHGLYFEAYFFACILRGELRLTRINSNIPVETFTLNFQATVQMFDPNRPTTVTCPRNTCLRPLRWDNPAFDAVFLYTRGRRNTIRFVQVTKSYRHGMKIQYCKDFFRNVRRAEIFSATDIEIVFIVPNSVLEQFRIGPLEDDPATTPPPGWPTGAIEDKVEVYGLNFELGR